MYVCKRKKVQCNVSHPCHQKLWNLIQFINFSSFPPFPETGISFSRTPQPRTPQAEGKGRKQDVCRTNERKSLDWFSRVGPVHSLTPYPYSIQAQKAKPLRQTRQPIYPSGRTLSMKSLINHPTRRIYFPLLSAVRT